MKHKQNLLILICLYFLSISCSTYTREKVVRKDLELSAIKCVLEENLKHVNNSKKLKIYVYIKLEFFKYQPYIGSLKENCQYCIKDTNEVFQIDSLPQINIPYEVVLNDTFVLEKNDPYYRFSPLIPTSENNIFSLIVESAQLGEHGMFIYLLKYNDNRRFEYLETLNGFVAH